MGPFCFGDFMSSEYKPFKDVSDQILLLKSRGVTFSKSELRNAEKYLGNINYFKFAKIYKNSIFTKQGCENHNLNNRYPFHLFLKIYNQEVEISNLTLKYILHFETMIRTNFAYNISCSTSNNTPYLNKEFIDKKDEKSQRNYENFCKKFSYTSYQNKDKINRSKSLISVLNHYHSKHNEAPPIWAIVECVDFGDLRWLIKMFDKIYLNNFYVNIFNVDDSCIVNNDKYIDFFNNFLSSINNLRNDCAHNNILFGSGFRLNGFNNFGDEFKKNVVFKDGQNFALVINTLYFFIYNRDKNLAKKMKKDFLKCFKKLEGIHLESIGAYGVKSVI